MKVTIEDCLKLDSFKASQVVAGKRNISNRVKSISVMDSRTIEDAVRCNGIRDQLVLTSFHTMPGMVALQAQLIKQLGKSGIGGLVVFRSQGLTKSDRVVVDAAEEVGLPLIVMSPKNKAGYDRVIEEIMDKLLYGDKFKNNLINNTIFHLLNFDRYASFEEAIREAAIYNNFQVILLSKDFNPIFTVETRHVTTIDEAIRIGKEVNVEKSDTYTQIDVNGVLTYWGPITISGNRLYLFIVDNEDNYSAGEMTKLAEIIEIAISMWKYTPQRDAVAELIKALNRGNTSLAYTLKDEIGLESNQLKAIFYGRGIDNSECHEVLRSIEADGLKTMTLESDDSTYGIVIKEGRAYEDNASFISVQRAIKSMLYNLKEAGKSSARIFYCTSIDGIEGACDGFKLIGDVCAATERVFPYKRLFSQYDMAIITNCMNIKMQGGRMKKIYKLLLEPFQEHLGENKARQLTNTLETFVLDAGMNSHKTAEFMGVHNNTVQYRLKKINEILGTDITGNRVIPGLTTALALNRLDVEEDEN